ncbi:MAG: hypothetical protein GY868_08145 [Deltaproteobacteria bacterium]|nr:hypothetical protein [Deltaproteobacteria bacterium]
MVSSNFFYDIILFIATLLIVVFLLARSAHGESRLLSGDHAMAEALVEHALSIIRIPLILPG